MNYEKDSKKSTVQRKKEAEDFMQDATVRILELIEKGYTFRFNLERTAIGVPSESEWKKFLLTGSEIIIIGISPKWFDETMEKTFDALANTFQK